MSAATLQGLVERYLIERRRLGFSDRTPAYALRSFARHVKAVGHRGALTVEVMADWARCDSHGSSDPAHLGAPAEEPAFVHALAAAVRAAHRGP